MDADPGQVIRSLRLALEMSQAEFARAAGWSPSTISSWERGRVKPSRLAFKTILAFAEERGVRYRPPSASRALVALPVSPAPDRAFPDGQPGPRPALRPLLYPERPEAVAEPGRTEVPRRGRDLPRWSAEANFRLTLGARDETARSVLVRRLVEITIVALGFCAAFGLRDPLRHLLGGTVVAARSAASAGTELPAARSAASAGAQLAAAPATVAPPPLAATVGPRRNATAPGSDVPVPAPVAPEVAVTDTTAPDTSAVTEITARLESVMAIGGAGRATFRTANDAITVAPGEWLGGLQVIAISPDAVTLVDRQGDRHRVQVGQHTRFD